MDQPNCPACKAENDEDAAYCDQCGQPLSQPARDEGSAEGGCPACGGAVEHRGGGTGVCTSCGLELHEAEGAPPVKADAGAIERLTQAILRKTGSGLAIEQAVAEGCREVFSAPEGEPAQGETAPAAAPAETQACPLCGAECPDEAKKCGGCGIWFHGFRTPQPCPRCERMTSGDKCECGAIMTLPRLLKYVEPAVRFICSRCKAPYAVSQPKCPDCGGGLLSADRIKAFAAES
ncbi:MAG TPA: zinc ribbon domain-containing protein [Elusimicrobiota bacterium]|jgi:predicted amidophosphoribosyltransferase|nr:zinc ribbon domain-containing protein [Elusimicrobiota bacterium]